MPYPPRRTKFFGRKWLPLEADCVVRRHLNGMNSIASSCPWKFPPEQTVKLRAGRNPEEIDLPTLRLEGVWASKLREKFDSDPGFAGWPLTSTRTPRLIGELFRVAFPVIHRKQIPQRLRVTPHWEFQHSRQTQKCLENGWVPFPPALSCKPSRKSQGRHREHEAAVPSL